jgi:hypothetical protein
MRAKEHGTAIHEAGHAVAHIRLGIQQIRATIEPVDSDLEGSVLADDLISDRDDASAQALALYAGYAATVAAGTPEDAARIGCDDDFSKAEDLIRSWRIGTADELMRRAVDLMSKPENISAVQLVAGELLTSRTLSVELLEALVEVADGNATAQEYEMFKQWVVRT